MLLAADQKCGDQPVCGQHGKKGERESWLFQLSRHGWEPGEEANLFICFCIHVYLSKI